MNAVATKRKVGVWGTYDEWRAWLHSVGGYPSLTDSEVLDNLRATALHATTELETKLRKSLGMPKKKRGKRS